ncbi:MAG TPA: S1/P1 nuclease [Allosphingosinicella sp.]|jgi:hypothetical protein
MAMNKRQGGSARWLLVLIALLLPSPAAAWWEYGHQTVARIAMIEAAPATRAEIARLLRHESRLETPTCRMRTIEEASVWPDCIRAMGDRFSYTAPWHYQNVNVCQPFDLTGPCRDGNCVSAQIERHSRLLKDRALPPRERLASLAFLVHFVGDMHQPMHAGDRADLGGNRFPAYYSRIRSNLHSIWDGHLAERAISTPAAEARGLLSEVAPGDRPAIAAGSVADWAREAWQVSREAAYGSLLADPCAPQPEQPPVLEQARIRELIPIVRRQVLRGGLRLARLLDEVLG